MMSDRPDRLTGARTANATKREQEGAVIQRLRAGVRNRLSRWLAVWRQSRRFQPFHRRYGPIKYGLLLPALDRLKSAFSPPTEADADAAYRDWAVRCERLRYDRDRAAAAIAQFAYQPTISIILPVYNPRLDHLRDAIESVLNQYYPGWQLCICDDGSTVPQVRETLDDYARRDARLKLVFAASNGGIAAASNRALSLASGDFVALLDHDDRLTPDAFFEVVATLQQADADLLYSDEDRLDAQGHRTTPRFKPAWSPDLLLSCMYLSHLSVYRKTILDRIGGFRHGFDGSQDYDLALRFTEQTSKIIHIPKILYHWRDLADSASARPASQAAVTDAGRRALSDALARRQIDGTVISQSRYGFYSVRRRIKPGGRVSIIIPTRDGGRRLRRCIAGIEAQQSYLNYEIIIVDNGSRHAATLDYLRRAPHRVIRHDAPFNFSQLNNIAACQTAGEYLLFLNDDTEAANDDWLAALVEHAQRAEVGAVGGKLLYADGRIQHAGIVLGLKGAAGHALRGEDGFSGAGYLNYANLTRNYNAVTAACLMMRRDCFDEIGGFDEVNFPVGFSDVDLCLRLRQRGYLIVFTPQALLYHHESATRSLARQPQADARLRARWHDELICDAYYNPNLSADREDFAVDLAKPESLVCTPSQETADAVICQLDGATRAGQRFFVEQDGLCGLGLRLDPLPPTARGVVRLRLRSSPASPADIAVVDLPVSQVRDDQWRVFCFAAIAESAGKHFYFCLERGAGEGAVNVMGSTAVEAADLLFINGRSLQASLALRVYTQQQFRYAPSAIPTNRLDS
jgi:glycosyltransferase involved in cell wall biosynthesis